jgi:hypothetical protein
MITRRIQVAGFTHPITGLSETAKYRRHSGFPVHTHALTHSLTRLGEVSEPVCRSMPKDSMIRASHCICTAVTRSQADNHDMRQFRDAGASTEGANPCRSSKHPLNGKGSVCLISLSLSRTLSLYGGHDLVNIVIGT